MNKLTGNLNRLKLLLCFVTVLLSLWGIAQRPTPEEDKMAFEQYEKRKNLESEDFKQILRIGDRAINYDIDLALNYFKRARKIYEEYESQLFYTEAWDRLGLAYMMKGTPEVGLKELETYMEKSPKLDKNHLLKLQIIKVRYLEHLDRNAENLVLINKLIPQTESPLFKASLYMFRGSIYKINGKYDLAGEDYYNALRLYKKINSKGNILTAYIRLGLLNQATQNGEKAIKYYNLALDIALKNNYEKDLAPIYINLGNIYLDVDSLDLALEYYDKNLEIISRSQSHMDIARNFMNRGKVYVKKKEYAKAFESFEKSLKICNEQGIDVGKMYNYIGLGDIYFRTKNHPKALSMYDSAVYYAKKIQQRDLEMGAYSKLSDTYKEMGNYKEALSFYTKFSEIQQELISEEKQKTLSELEIKYETELKDQEIVQKDEMLAAKKAENRLIILTSSILFLLTALIIFFLVYRNKTIKQLYERNVELMKSMQYRAPEEPPTDPIETISESDDSLRKVFDRILYSLEKEKIYINPNLSLSDTAEHVKSNDKYVSAAIAEYAGMNYSNFINFYRINEAKHLIYENSLSNLNEIMCACGFNSRTTFYNAFKKHTGLSPKQFKELGSLEMTTA